MVQDAIVVFFSVFQRKPKVQFSSASNQSESTISNGSSTNKSEDKKKKDENELVMQSDDEISLDSNDGQLFDKTVRMK